MGGTWLDGFPPAHRLLTHAIDTSVRTYIHTYILSIVPTYLHTRPPRAHHASTGILTRTPTTNPTTAAFQLPTSLREDRKLTPCQCA